MDAAAQRYTNWTYLLRLDGLDYNVESYDGRMPWEVHHLFGEPAATQGDPRFVAAFISRPDPELAEASAWTPLLALHDDNALELYILDAGAYTVVVPLADLRSESFARAVCTLQSC